MAQTLDLSTTFLHLGSGGSLEPIELTPSFWRESAAEDRYDRLVGVYDFNSPEDLHSSMQEVHPAADELLFLVSGAIDVLVQDENEERTVALEAGQAAVVPRGVWHRLVMRQPGRILFINSRSGMQSRHV